MRLLHLAAGAMCMLGLTACGGGGGSSSADSPSHDHAAQSTAEAAGPAATNPVAPDAQSVQLGRAIYAKNCQSCHGPRGKGDGPAVGRLNVEVPDLADPDVQSQPDGTLFN